MRKSWVGECVTAGTQISLYLSHTACDCACKCASQHERALTQSMKIICDQHQSKSLFCLSVAYRSLIIHSSLPEPSGKVGNSIFSPPSNTRIPVEGERMCLGYKRIHRSLLWKLAHDCTHKNGSPLMWTDAVRERPCNPTGNAPIKDRYKTKRAATWSTEPDNSFKLQYAQGKFTYRR